MTNRYTKNYGEILDSGSVEHGLTDRQGRSVGYKWRIRAVSYVSLPNTEAQYGYYLRPDDSRLHVFELWGQPTRDGKGYGPAFNTVEFPTLEQARRDAVRRVEQARKRDAKKFSA
jgi:hypothetical protein